MTIKELKQIIENNGATLNSNGESVNFMRGYQVSKKDCYTLTIKNANKILRAVNGLLDNITAGEFVGLWVDNGLIYIELTDLFNGDLQETDDYPDSNGKRTYQGGIFTAVKGYEQLEFVIVNINDHKHHFPIKLLIWAKEIKL